MNHGLGYVVSRGGAALKEDHLAVLRESEEIFEVSQFKLEPPINKKVRINTKLLIKALRICHDETFSATRN